ncbi:MAG: sensor histidine kinase [Spirochaetaceae bacterium]
MTDTPGVPEDGSIPLRDNGTSDLEHSAETVDSLFAAAPVGIGVVVDRVLRKVNEQLCVMTGYAESELLGHSLRLLYASEDEYERVGAYKYPRLAEDGVCALETRFVTRENEVIDVYMRSAALDRRDLGKGVIFTVLDVTEQKRTERVLEEAARQKETLLRELHHRSKNNMQIIASFLNLESERRQGTEAVEPLQKMRSRIRSMALVHEKLYRGTELERVDLAEYAETLSAEVVSLHGSTIDRHLDAERIHVGIDFAVPFGLILNELLSNSLQHGFGSGAWARARGSVHIAIRRRGENVFLRVKDNGYGFPSDFRTASADSLGLQLVSALVEQLRGSIELRGGDGTEWIVELRDVSLQN